MTENLQTAIHNAMHNLLKYMATLILLGMLTIINHQNVSYQSYSAAHRSYQQ